MKAEKTEYTILGAGGHAKVIVDILLKNKIENIIILDDLSKCDVLGFPISGNLEMSLEYPFNNSVIAIGDNYIRKKISEKYDLNYAKCIHPNAVVANGVFVDIGTVVMANAVINSGCSIGKHCIINTASIIEHDNNIGNYVHISPGVKLGGNVKVGDNTWIGIGATVKNNINICNDVVIGAGAIVVNDINEPGVYVGIPARVK